MDKINDRIHLILSKLNEVEKQNLFNLDLYEELERTRKKFVNKFTKEYILKQMKLEDYVEQDRDKNNFVI